MRYSEICRKTLRSFVWIERSGLAGQVDLRWLEAAEYDSTLVCQHTVGPVEAQPVGVLQQRLHCIDDCAEIALISWRGHSDCSPDFVFSETTHMVGDTSLSQPRDHGGDMVVKSMYSIRVASSIALCLSDVIFLAAKEVVLPGCLSLVAPLCILSCHFEISLPRRNLEHPLTGVILCPNFVACMGLFQSGITATLLLIDPTMSSPAMLPHSACSPAYIGTGYTAIIQASALQPVEVYRQMSHRRVACGWVYDV